MPEPLTITAVLNGAAPDASHPRLPTTTAALVADALAVHAAGARTVVLQACDPRGAATLDPEIVDDTVHQIRRACPDVGIGVRADGDGDLDARRRATLLERWTEPDFAVVRLWEPGHADVMDAALWAGRAVAVVVSTPGDVQRLNRTGMVDDVSRAFVALADTTLDGREQVALAGAVERALDAAAVRVPRVRGGSGAACWFALTDAVASGHDIQVGLADTLVMPDGRPAASNAALVRAARKLIEQPTR